MDPITLAIVTAVSTGAISGLAEAALPDAYHKLKALLTKKFGGESDVLYAVNQVEAKPDSAARKAALQEEITAAKADQDPDLLSTAHALIELLRMSPEGEQHVQTATGSYIAQADRESRASVNIGRPPEQ